MVAQYLIILIFLTELLVNTQRPVLLLVIAVVSSLFSSRYAHAYNTVYVNNNDAVTAELMRQRAEHERRYPSQDRSMEILRDLYDSNKFFYKLPSVLEQLDYLLELYPDGIEKGENLVAMSKMPVYHQKKYILGVLFTAIGVLSGQEWIKLVRNIDKQEVDPLCFSAVFMFAPIISIVSLKAAYDQFKMTARWCANRLQKDQAIYALLLKEAKKIKS